LRLYSAALMANDMSNMLRVAEAMDKMNFHLPFDHTSILKEYQNQVPLEFDFTREKAMLNSIGSAVTAKAGGVM
jgi:aarF domain-containing kinase